MVKAAIFDMDGLLINSEPFWHKAHMAAVKSHGHTITEDDVRKMAGQRTVDIARQWKKRFGIETVSAEDLADEIIQAVITSIKQDGQVLPGVHHVIGLLAEHNIPMAIASSATPDVIDAVMERLKLESHMQFTYSAIHEPKGKPDPGVFLTTARKLGVSPANCIVFEDAVSGGRAAKAAGMKCIAVPEAINLSRPEFQEADLIVPSLEDVSWDILDQL